MSGSLDEQVGQVAGVLTVPAGAAAIVRRRLGTADAWLVAVGMERLVLKRGRPEQDEADVTWEHEYLARLAEAGFPASVPVPALDGQSWARVDGRTWAVLRYLPGNSLASQPGPDMEAAGAFLARYHQAARSIPLPGQRPTAAGLTWLRRVTPWTRLRAALGDVSKLGLFVALLENLEVGLRNLKYDSLEHLVIHGDATNDNLIVNGAPPCIVGLIDFGAAHVAPWIADLAAALWRSGRPDPDAIAYDTDRIGHFVIGYHRESPLPPKVASAVPLLMLGRGLQLMSRRVRRLPPGQPSAPIPDVLLTLRRTAWLHAHRDEITDAITAATAPDHGA